MVFKVILSELALQDLKEIAHFIGLHDPEAAQKYCHQLLDKAEALESNPYVGTQCPEFDDRLIRFIVYRNHRIVFKIDDETAAVHVSRFWHGARGYLLFSELES